MAEDKEACPGGETTPATGGFAYVEETVLRQVVREIALTLEKNEEKFQKIADKIDWLALSISGLIEQRLPHALRGRPTEILTFPEIITEAGREIVAQTQPIPYPHILKQITVLFYAGEGTETTLRLLTGDEYDPEIKATLNATDIFSTLSMSQKSWIGRGFTIDVNFPIPHTGNRFVAIFENDITGIRYGLILVIERMI